MVTRSSQPNGICVHILITHSIAQTYSPKEGRRTYTKADIDTAKSNVTADSGDISLDPELTGRSPACSGLETCV